MQWPADDESKPAPGPLVLVQALVNTVELPDGSDLHLTIRHWFLPDGSSVEQKGLTPTVTAKLASPDDMFDASKPELGHARDTQLNQALDVLGKGAA